MADFSPEEMQAMKDSPEAQEVLAILNPCLNALCARRGPLFERTGNYSGLDWPTLYAISRVSKLIRELSK